MTLNFFVTLEVYLSTLFSKIFCFSNFCLGTGRDGTAQDGTDGTGQTGQMGQMGQTDRHTDRQTFLGKYYFRCSQHKYCDSTLYFISLGFLTNRFPLTFKSLESMKNYFPCFPFMLPHNQCSQPCLDDPNHLWWLTCVSKRQHDKF